MLNIQYKLCNTNCTIKINYKYLSYLFSPKPQREYVFNIHPCHCLTVNPHPPKIKIKIKKGKKKQYYYTHNYTYSTYIIIRKRQMIREYVIIVI